MAILLRAVHTIIRGIRRRQIIYLIFLVILIIYFICAILLESFKQPFVVISLIPFSFIGVFLTFHLFNINC